MKTASNGSTREKGCVTDRATIGRRADRAWEPRRGQVWWIDLGETIGHEQAGRRPALVLSDPRHDPRRDGLLSVVPITRRDRGIPLHVRVPRGQGGLPEASVLLVDQVRAVSRLRLGYQMDRISPELLSKVEERVARHLLTGWKPPELARLTMTCPACE